MIRLTLGQYILDINAKETENYYKNKRYVSEECECDGCQNYELAVELVSLEVSKMFEAIGLDIRKPVEVYVNYSNNNILCYGGFYHISGDLLKGESPWENISKTEKSMESRLVEEKMISIANNYKITFQEKCSLLDDNFPKPCIQMEILAYLPWLLNKSNTFQEG